MKVLESLLWLGVMISWLWVFQSGAPILQQQYTETIIDIQDSQRPKGN